MHGSFLMTGAWGSFAEILAAFSQQDGLWVERRVDLRPQQVLVSLCWLLTQGLGSWESQLSVQPSLSLGSVTTLSPHPGGHTVPWGPCPQTHFGDSSFIHLYSRCLNLNVPSGPGRNSGPAWGPLSGALILLVPSGPAAKGWGSLGTAGPPHSPVELQGLWTSQPWP